MINFNMNPFAFHIDIYHCILTWKYFKQVTFEIGGESMIFNETRPRMFYLSYDASDSHCDFFTDKILKF